MTDVVFIPAVLQIIALMIAFGAVGFTLNLVARGIYLIVKGIL